MTDWKIARYQNEPDELDRSSSPTTVYERRNIHEVITEDSSEWECEERLFSKDEWEQQYSPFARTVMQTLSALQLQIAELED